MRPRSITRTTILLVSALGILAPTPAWSQATEGDSLKELLELLNTKVTVASKSAESLNAAPGIITVVTRPEIEGFAAQNLGQVLNRVVGMALLSPDIFPNQSLVIRGQETTPYNNHVLVLLNGRPMRDPITGGLNGSYWNAFPISAVEKLEIIRGPGSVLYGSCAYSGVVNIVTRTREEEGVGGQITLGTGSYQAAQRSGHVQLRMGDFKGIVGISQFRDLGAEASFTDYNGTLGSGRFFQRNLGLMAHLEYSGLTLNAYHGNYDPYTLEGSSEAWDPNVKSQQITTHFDLGYSRELNAVVSLGANLTYNQTDWYTGERTVTSTPAFQQAFTGGDATLFEVMAKIKPLAGLNIIVGGGGEKASWGKAKNPFYWGPSLVIPGDQKSTFLYAQADYRIQMVKLIGGLQYNKLENIDGNISPRLGVIADFTPELGAKLLYSTAFRKGYPNETGFNVSVFRGNPLLQPETISTIEAQVFYQTPKAQASLTYYQSKMKDIVTRKFFAIDPPPPSGPPFYLQYLNGGSWDYSGFEAEGRISVTPRVLVTGSLSYQTNENEAGVKNATLHPNLMAKAGVLYTGSRWTLSLFDAYFGKPKPTTLVNPGSAMVNKEPEAYHLVSAKVGWKAMETAKTQVKLALEGNNLAGTDIRYPDYPNKSVNSLIPISSGRTWSASITVIF